MIKFIRQQAVENRWVLATLMGVIAIAFVISMGYGGFSLSSDSTVATVAGVAISQQEYSIVYRSQYQVYQQIFKDQFTPEFIEQLDLKHTVLNQLIDMQLWQIAADRLGLSVTDEELMDALKNNAAFQRNGQFDPYIYEQTLVRNNWTPQRFEASERLRLLAEKAKAAVRASVMLVPAEEPSSPPPAVEVADTEPPPPSGPTAETLLQQKADRAVMAYLAILRQQTEITINERQL